SVDLADVTRARADMRLVADLEVMAPHLASSLEAVRNHTPVTLRYDGPSCEPTIEPPRSSSSRNAAKKSSTKSGEPFALVAIPSERLGPSPLEIDAMLTADWLTEFIRDGMGQRGFQLAGL